MKDLKLPIALVLSAAIIWLSPNTKPPVNNLGQKAAETRTANKATLVTHDEHTAEVVKPVETPAPQTQVAQPETQGCTSYAGVFNQYDWNVSVAKAICQAESSGNPQAVSDPSLNYDDKSDYGLMQIHAEPIFNPQANIARAYQKYQSQGWKAWSTYNNGAYLAYIN